MLVAVTEKAQAERSDIVADERGRYRVLPEWISQATLINVGLIVLGVYLVSALITTGATDIASRVAIVAWAAAMPLLAVNSLITELQRTRRYASYPWYFVTAQGIAQGAALVGFGAALWHAWYVAAIVLVVTSVAGLVLYRAYYRRLERDNEPDRGRRRR